MKKIALIGGMLILSSCGGGGGESSLDTTNYRLATLSNPQEVETTPTATTQTIKSLTAVSESATTAKAENPSSKGLVVELIQKTFHLQPTRTMEVTVPCDSGFLLADISYKLKEGVSQAQSCNDIESVGIIIYDAGVECRLGDYFIDEKGWFSMTISGSDLQDPDCLPQKASVEVKDGVIKHLSEDGIVDEAYKYDNLKIAYSNIVWSGDEIASAKYTITGGASYYLGNFPLNVSAQIDYYFDITGSGSETSDTFSGYVKFGCLDGWLKVETTKPLKYSGDSTYDGEIKVSANNGQVVISYTPSGIDITETVDNQTNTYHYNSFDEIRETVNGTVCVGE